MTKKEMQIKIKELKDQKIKVSQSYLRDVVYVKLNKQLQQIKQKYVDEIITPAIIDIDEQIETLEQQLNLNSKCVYVLPDILEAVRKNMLRGVDYGPKGLTPIMSWGNRFMLLKRGGYNGWSGRGETTYYGIKYTLHDITIKEKNGPHGNDWFERTKLAEYENVNTKTTLMLSEQEIETQIKTIN